MAVPVESRCPDETLRVRGINLNQCILRMFEDTFSLCAAHMASGGGGWGGGGGGGGVTSYIWHSMDVRAE